MLITTYTTCRDVKKSPKGFVISDIFDALSVQGVPATPTFGVFARVFSETKEEVGKSPWRFQIIAPSKAVVLDCGDLADIGQPGFSFDLLVDVKGKEFREFGVYDLVLTVGNATAHHPLRVTLAKTSRMN